MIADLGWQLSASRRRRESTSPASLTRQLSKLCGRGACSRIEERRRAVSRTTDETPATRNAEEFAESKDAGIITLHENDPGQQGAERGAVYADGVCVLVLLLW